MNYFFGNSDHVWHVAKSGDTGNSGHTFALAKETIAQVIALAASGDTIIVWPGVYAEQVDLQAAGLSVVLAGTNKHHSVVDYDSGHAIESYKQCQYHNLRVEAAGGTAATGIIKGEAGTSDVEIADCSIDAPYDCVQFSHLTTPSYRIRTIRCDMSGDFDANNYSGVQGCLMSDCLLQSDGSWATSADCRAMHSADVSGGLGIVSACIMDSRRDDASTAACHGADARGMWIFDECIFEADSGEDDSGCTAAFYNRDCQAAIAASCFYAVSDYAGEYSYVSTPAQYEYGLFDVHGYRIGERRLLKLAGCNFDPRRIAGRLVTMMDYDGFVRPHFAGRYG